MIYLLLDRTPAEQDENIEYYVDPTPYYSRAEARRAKQRMMSNNCMKNWEIKIFKLVEVR